ncbi:hypothetical protein JCM10450v2_006490 [Rhodotorula kratochvilovae]
MRTSLALAALGASAALPGALALSYSTGHANPGLAKRHHNQLAQAHVDKRRSAIADKLTKRGKMQRRVRRQDTAALLAVKEDNSTSSAASSSSSAKAAVYESTAIWWAEAGWVGTCGETISDDALIVGLPLAVYPDVAAASPLCGTSVSVVAPSTGKRITATVIGASDRDDFTTFSKAAYVALGGDLDTGMLAIQFSLGDETAAEVVQSASVSKASVSSASKAASSVAAPSSSSVAESSSSQEEKVATPASAAAKVVAAATSAAPTTTQAPTTTARPTTTTSAWDSESYASSSSAAAAAAKSKADAEWAASSSSSAEAYQLWASSSSSAAAASKASADAAWAASSSSSAAAAASSKAAADAAWASSSSAAAAAAKETQSSSSGGGSSSGGSGKVYSGGIATYFYQNGVAGNCGKVNSDSTLLVALPTNSGGSHCGKYVKITRTATGDSINALVADSCPTCNNDSCLDLSWGAFSALGGTESMGVFDITWQFI